MRAFPCENMAYFERVWCIFDDEAFPSMGFNAYKSKGLIPGIRTHLLLTNSMSPFCGKFGLYSRIPISRTSKGK